jgi:hypothetical protein
MNAHTPKRYWCVSSAGTERRRYKPVIQWILLLVVITTLGLSGCTGVTTAKSNSATAANSSTTAAGPSANPAAASAGSLSASPAAVTFGTVQVGSVSNVSLTLTNSGSTPVTISQTNVTGAGFAVAGASLPLTLSPGNAVTFTVSFAPTAAGAASGSCSIVSAQLGSPLLVQMSGTGAAVGPAISSEPINQSVIAGQSATFSVTASGTAPLSYQWKRNGIAISGATMATYTTGVTTTSDNGAQFAVTVSNSAGTVTSTAATLTVTATAVAPTITSQPVSQTIFAGQTATFSVAASGTAPLSYQWKKNGIAISGATSSSYTTPVTTTSDNGAQFTVIVTNLAGSMSSSPATLTVNPDPVAPAISTQPASQTVNAGLTATFSVTATGSTPLSYQWRKNGASITGANLSSYTTPPITSTDNGAQFTVFVSNSAGIITSNAAILTVNAPPTITSQPSNLTVIVGQTATFSVTATGTAPLVYQWRKNGANISGATASTYTTPATTSTDTGAQFSVVISNVAGTMTSNTATLTVNSPPIISTQPASQTIIAGQTATFSVTASGTAPLSYQWRKNGTAISGATSSSYTTPAETTADNGAQFTVVVSNSTGNVTSNAATLTVNSNAVAPSITTQPTSQTVTAGQTATFSVTASGTSPLSYQWNKNGAAISGATSSSYTTPATTSADNGAQFTVVVSNSVGSVTSNIAILTVNTPPSLTTQPVSQTVIVGQTATFSVAATGTAPLSYQWRKNSTNISGATASTYTTPATAATDNGSQFSVVIGNVAGTTTSNSATLTVNVPPSITTQPTSQTITAGQAATFSVTASGTAPLSYQWRKNGTAISGATSSSYTTPAETTADNGAQFTVMVSNSVGNITSNVATLTVNSVPGPLVASTSTLTFGSVNVGSSSILSVNFTNSGSSNVTVSSVSISGAGFTPTGVSNGQIITPGQVVTLNVTFAPAATGSVNGSVTVASNASNSPATITLSGTGVQSTITSITVTPANPTIAPGSQIQFKAVDNFGNDITSSVLWSSSDTSIATITSGGLATGIATGTVTITASQ